jgi:hypothetical protein
VVEQLPSKHKALTANPSTGQPPKAQFLLIRNLTKEETDSCTILGLVMAWILNVLKGHVVKAWLPVILLEGRTTFENWGLMEGRSLGGVP